MEIGIIQETENEVLALSEVILTTYCTNTRPNPAVDKIKYLQSCYKHICHFELFTVYVKLIVLLK